MTTRIPIDTSRKLMCLRDSVKKSIPPCGQRGSIAVMIAFLIPVLLLMVAMIANINQLVFTKIKLQNTVDACALSAAAVQAAGLNEIADLNGEMMRENANAMRILSSSPPWHTFSHARKAGAFFYNGKDGVLDWIRKYQKQVNVNFADMAHRVALDVKRRNLPKSFLNDRNKSIRLTALREKYNDAEFRYFSASFSKGSPVSTTRWFDPDDPRYADSHDGRYWLPAKRTMPLTDRFRLLEKVQKNSPTYVDYELILPPHPFLAGGTIFGDMPRLEATAVARPAGGNIFDAEPFYYAVLEK